VGWIKFRVIGSALFGKNMKWLTLIFAIASSVLFCSCKPQPISGQLFLTDGSGIVKPIPAVEILLVDAKDADDFINRKQLEAKRTIKKRPQYGRVRI
jgi:hypothetical protein